MHADMTMQQSQVFISSSPCPFHAETTQQELACPDRQQPRMPTRKRSHNRIPLALSVSSGANESGLQQLNGGESYRGSSCHQTNCGLAFTRSSQLCLKTYTRVCPETASRRSATAKRCCFCAHGLTHSGIRNNYWQFEEILVNSKLMKDVNCALGTFIWEILDTISFNHCGGDVDG